MQDSTKALCRRVAGFLLAGISVSVISTATDLPAESIEKMKDNKDFLVILKELAEEQAARAVETDANWDVVQDRALNIVADNLEWNADPEFALKAAAVAAKAPRRSRPSGPDALVGQINGDVVMINLNSRFTEQLQNSPLDASPLVSTENASPVLDGEAIDEDGVESAESTVARLTQGMDLSIVPGIIKRRDLPSVKRITEILNLNSDEDSGLEFEA